MSPRRPGGSERVPLFQRSLLSRIVVSFFLLSSLIVVSLTVFSFWYLTRSARRQQMQQIDAIATIKAVTLERWVEDQVHKTQVIIGMPEVQRGAAILCAPGGGEAARRKARQALEDSFTRLLFRFPEVRSLALLSGTGGQILVSTDVASEGSYRVLDSEFLQGMRGVSIQNVHPSPITLEPTMSISAPLFGRASLPYGVIVATLNLDSMDLIIQDKAGLGTTGEAYLVDKFSTFVSGSRFGRVNYPRGVHSRGIEAALRRDNGTASYLNYDGIPVIGAYRWIKDRDLALLVEVHQAEAFRAAWVQTILLVAFGFSLVLALAFGVYVLARRLALPILAIQKAAQRVTSGSLDAEAPVLTRDEVGDLARSFNRMTATVRGLYEEIRRKEEHFRTLIESSLDMVIVLNADGSVSFASPSVERSLGYSPPVLQAMPPFSLIHPEDVAQFREDLARLGGEADAVLLGVPLKVVRSDGVPCMLEANVRNLLDHPAVRGFVINARDITERRLLEEKLRQAQKMEAVGRLAGGVAHDFNNLLTVVLGYTDALFASGRLETEAVEYATEIGKAATRAAELTHQLLAYSRKQVLQPRNIDLNLLLSGMNGMLKRLIGEDVTITQQAAPDLMPVRADPSQISQVVMNLAANARDAMPHGGAILFETRNVVLDEESCRQLPELFPGPFVTLAVSDTGSGMDDETRGRIFDPFFTTKGVGKGTGLGLATVYGILRQSGGHITVRSAVGEGSTFTLYLPVSPEAPPTMGLESAEQDIPSGSETILVVEDEEPLRRMISMTLRRAGYRVGTAAGFREASERVVELGRIDLLLTDVILPGRNGREIAAELQRLQPSMRVILMSGYAEHVIGRQGVITEATAFLQKPFSLADLARKIRDVLDDSRLGGT